MYSRLYFKANYSNGMKRGYINFFVLDINMKIIYYPQVFIPSNTRILRKDKIFLKIKAS